MLAAFANRDFRLFWTRAFVSNIGSWLQAIAQGWLVLQLTDSPLALGLVSFAGSVPILLFSLVGGVIIDRVDRRAVLIWTQSLLLVLAIGLAAITWLGIIRVEHVIFFALLTGLVTALNAPAWQAYITDLVGPSELMNAIALNSTQFNLSRVIGPSIAGVLLAVVGPAGCFFLNGLSFLAVVVALLLIPRRPMKPLAKRESTVTLLRTGLDYAIGNPVLRVIVLLTAVMTIFGLQYATLMPAMARDVLGLGADGYGELMAATGVGAIFGSLTVASLGRRLPRGPVLLASQLGFALALLGFAESRSFTLAAVLLAVLGFCMVAYMTIANTTLQLLSPDELRGRIMSIWTLVSWGFSPVGALQAGAVAEFWGTPVALGIGGLACTVAAVVAAFAPALRLLPSAAKVDVVGPARRSEI